jgi:predicted nucleic acid-binding protein
MSTLIDSDVLVWLTRGHVGAARRLHALSAWRISVVTYMELAQGCRDKAELTRLKQGLAAQQTEIVPITPAVSELAADMIDGLALSHGIRLADALIAATALVYVDTLLTANTKHFGAIQGLDLETFEP